MYMYMDMYYITVDVVFNPAFEKVTKCFFHLPLQSPTINIAHHCIEKLDIVLVVHYCVSVVPFSKYTQLIIKSAKKY